MRRAIDELVALYEFEPTLVDVYVEGSFDQKIYRNVAKAKFPNLSVYQIDSIDVPFDVLAKYGLTEGKRQRLIALAAELRNIDFQAKVIFLVDRDYDDWNLPYVEYKRLRRSAFTTPEAYFLTKKSVNDLVKLYGEAHIENFESFFESLTKALLHIYAIRLAIKSLNLQVKLPDLGKNLELKNETISINSDRYINALVNNNAEHKVKSKFLELYSQHLSILVGDIRKTSHGNDFVTSIVWAIRKYKGNKDMCSESVIRNLMIAMASSVCEFEEEIA